MTIKKSPLIPSRSSSALIVIDFQEKLIPAIFNAGQITVNIEKLLLCSNILGVRTFFTEQNPEKLGATAPAIRKLIRQEKPLLKTAFSVRGQTELWEHLSEHGIEQVIITGIESHVCVMQSALDLIANGYRVTLVADATGSRFKENYDIALARMRAVGVDISSTESTIFELLEDYTYPEFRDILKIIK
ncbi:MAG: isochorismatase family protein [Ignavibacteriaceae bacterium]|nr:isochorismatase family protein [Ignavibacteriaceae bacterium]